MGSVAEAVLEFDEAVQVPWRPPLAGAVRPSRRPSRLHVVAAPRDRRPHAARAARLTVPARTPAAPAMSVRRSPAGSTAVGHTCLRCAGDDRAAPGLRLTRRARRLLGVLLGAAAMLVGLSVGSVLGGGDEELVLVGDSSVVVRQGDTLWSIARSVAGEQDVRVVVDAIQELNGLHDASLRPGQELLLP